MIDIIPGIKAVLDILKALKEQEVEWVKTDDLRAALESSIEAVEELREKINK